MLKLNLSESGWLKSEGVNPCISGTFDVMHRDGEIFYGIDKDSIHCRDWSFSDDNGDILWYRPKPDLTTLDTPFGELDRATQLALCEHVLDGGKVEKYVDDNWEPKTKKPHCLSFMAGIKYRAKPK